MKKILILVGTAIALILVLRNVNSKIHLSIGQQAQGSNQTFKSLNSVDKADSLWVVVNKARALNPIDYIPNGLVAPNIPLRLDATDSEMTVRSDTAKALEALVAGAENDNIHLMLSSGYRSYKEQVSLYNYYIGVQGRVAADEQSARPGHSEHQTGLAADLEPASRQCEVQLCFANLPEGKWLAANAYKYGFTIRYQQGKQSIVGYEYEPWHIRYVGTDLAKALHQNNDETLEEYFNTGAAPNYK